MIIKEKEMLDLLNNAGRVFLLEPDYRRKYPPLGLAKIAGYLRERNAEFEFGRAYDGQNCDLVCITSLFTFQSQDVFDAVEQVQFLNPGVPILLGGVFASLMPKMIDRRYPHVYLFRGYSKSLDRCRPNYAIADDVDEPWTNFSYVFTSRGCPNRCPYCAVWRIEPEQWLNPEWKSAIADDKPYVMISDNNLSAAPFEHIEEVVNHCSEHGKRIVFDNGFDCKHITPEMAKLLSTAKYTRSGMRLAFDRIEEDGLFQDAVRTLLAAGVPRSQIMAYVLFNFNDTPEEANYRMRECVKLGIRPYPQRYEPLNELSREHKFVGKHWNEPLLRQFRHFWLMAGYYTKMSFAEYQEQQA